MLSSVFRRTSCMVLMRRCCAQAVEVEKQYDLTNKAKASAQNAMNAVRRSRRCKSTLASVV
jgi:hypothetical protein